MAVIFPNIMTALLARPSIATYFPVILRKRVEVPKYSGQFPMLQTYVIDNAARQDGGDGRAVQVANYVAIAAAKMAAGQNQDALIAEMVDALETAARELVYQVDGWSADAELENWASDDSVGAREGDRVWVEVPLTLRYMQS